MAKTKTKKIKKSKHLFLKLLIIVAMVVVGAVLVIEFVDFDQIFKHSEEAPVEQGQIINPDEEEKTVSTAPIDDEEGKEEIVQYEGENPNKAENLTGNITYAGVVNKKVMIRVNINQFLNNGTCTLIMKNGDATYSEKASIIESASTSTCKGFDISTDKLKSGEWSIEITVQSGDRTGSMKGIINL